MSTPNARRGGSDQERAVDLVGDWIDHATDPAKPDTPPPHTMRLSGMGSHGVLINKIAFALAQARAEEREACAKALEHWMFNGTISRALDVEPVCQLCEETRCRHAADCEGPSLLAVVRGV